MTTSVDSGTGGFMDEDACHALKALLDESDVGMLPALEDALSASYGDTCSAVNLSLPGLPANFTVFTSGDGDGAYPSYWGFDDAGQLCCLMTDFCILDT